MMKSLWLSLFVTGSLCLWVPNTAALGGDYPDCKVGAEPTRWPEGLRELATCSECVYGFFVNAEDVFFYAGDTNAFRDFLAQYAAIKQISSHKLVLHSGTCQAKSPWSQVDRTPCDWQLQIYPKGWRDVAARADGRLPEIGPEYVVEVHIWRKGKVSVNEVDVPRSIEVLQVEEGVPAGNGASN